VVMCGEWLRSVGAVVERFPRADYHATRKGKSFETANHSGCCGARCTISVGNRIRLCSGSSSGPHRATGLYPGITGDVGSVVGGRPPAMPGCSDRWDSSSRIQRRSAIPSWAPASGKPAPRLLQLPPHNRPPPRRAPSAQLPGAPEAQLVRLGGLERHLSRDKWDAGRFLRCSPPALPLEDGRSTTGSELDGDPHLMTAPIHP